MKKRWFLLWLACFFTSLHAKDCFDCAPFYWGISGSFGGTVYQNSYADDGKSALGRLALEAQYAVNDIIHLGLESGLQNGVRMRLAIPKPLLDILAGEPIHATIKPSIDLLATLKLTPFESSVFGYAKGGIAFRQLQVDRNEVNDVSETTPELQVGIGYGFSDNSYLFVGYQHLFGHDINYQVDSLTERGHLDHIPGQDSLLIGVSILF